MNRQVSPDITGKNSPKPGPGSFATITFGCKLNQYDTWAMEEKLRQAGWQKTSDPQKSQILIINTCTVTHKADSDARRAARSWRSKKPNLFIVFAGCYTQHDSTRLKELIPEADLFWGNTQKYHIQTLLEQWQARQANATQPIYDQIQDIFSEKEVPLVHVYHFHEHSRAFVKIQDGCDLRCSYCIVPYTRGRNRSVSPQLLIPYLRELRRQGYHEAVLTGIHIGTYGKDQGSSLVKLLRLIEEADLDIKIRLSSLDSNEISSQLLDFLSRSKIIRPHFHIPLQSGSDHILQKMNRKYTAQQFLETLSRLQSIDPDILLSTDIIVGFPGETEKDFFLTQELLTQSPLRHGHIFSFSKRKGTPAFAYPHQVPAPVIKERSQILRYIAQEKYMAFAQSQVGKERAGILLLTQHEPQILTDNYLQFNLTTPKRNLSTAMQPGQEMRVRVIAKQDQTITCVPV